MKVALFIATPVKTNSGMFSVDLAAVEVLKKLGVSFDIFVSQDKNYKFMGVTSKHYNSHEQLEPYSHLIFWGDFINNPMYGFRDFASRDVSRGYSQNRVLAFQRWMYLYALKGFQKGEKKIASFGNNFHFKSSEISKDVSDALASIAEVFDLIMPRDNFSALNLCSYFPDLARSKIGIGMDCAFLLRGANLEPRKYEASVFFYRSKIPDVEVIFDKLGTELGVTLNNYNWLGLNGERDIQFESQIQKIRQSIFAVTDTYHFAINCIREGVLPICVGRNLHSEQSTLSEFKKKEHYRSIGLSDFYIEFDENNTAALADRIMDKCRFILSNQSYVSALLDGIRLCRIEPFRTEIENFCSI